MNKLIAVEACRCLAVIQDSIDVLERINCVTPTLFTLGLDFDTLLNKDLSLAMKKYQQTRTTLESLRTELSSVKAAGFKARLKSIQRKIEASTDLFQKAVRQLLILLAGENDFIPKLERAGIQVASLQPQQIIVGGGNRSGATGSVAGDLLGTQSQTGTIQGQGPQAYATVADVINILKSLHHVVSIEMRTSSSQEKQKKAVLAALAASERSSQAQIQSLRKELDVTTAQCSSSEEQLELRITGVNEALHQNATEADAESTRLVEICSSLELQSLDSYNKRINTIVPELAELQRKVNDICKRHRDQITEVQRSKRRSELQVRQWVKNYDERCKECDDLIYRLRYEVNISRDRISVLEGIVNEYNVYLAERTSQFEGREEVWRQFMLTWELPAVVYETQHKEFA